MEDLEGAVYVLAVGAVIGALAADQELLDLRPTYAARLAGPAVYPEEVPDFLLKECITHTLFYLPDRPAQGLRDCLPQAFDLLSF